MIVTVHLDHGALGELVVEAEITGRGAPARFDWDGATPADPPEHRVVGIYFADVFELEDEEPDDDCNLLGLLRDTVIEALSDHDAVVDAVAEAVAEGGRP